MSDAITIRPAESIADYHACQDAPETIKELRRVLFLHVDSQR